MNKYKRLLQLVLLFAGGFVAGSLIAALLNARLLLRGAIY